MTAAAPRVLIAGAGIAGLTLAWWLDHWGFDVVVVEIAPAIRGGGYMIDFWDPGFQVAERMGLKPRLERAHYDIPKLDLIDARGRVRSSIDIAALRKALGYRHFNLLRSSLERVLYEGLSSRVEVRFETHVDQIAEHPDRVEVALVEGSRSRHESFDFVVGADGLHSRTRAICFGPESSFVRFLGYYTASYTLAREPAERPLFVTYATPDRQVSVYSLDQDRLAAFFVWREPSSLARLNRDAQRSHLRTRFAGAGWRVEELLAGAKTATDFYFDAVSQIDMPTWSNGRVTLVGDSCDCVSLISGQGSAIAMAGAYLLAGALATEPDHVRAFAAYEALLRPEVQRKQMMARRFASSFVPASRAGILVMHAFVRLMSIPAVSRSFLKRFVSNTLQLPTFEPDPTRASNAHDSSWTSNVA